MKNGTKKFNSGLLENKKMSPEVYKLRRQVIELVYEAKRLVPTLPRIEVRVTDNSNSGVAGCARMNDCVIWMTEKFTASKQVVFHEILHAAYGIKHVEGCLLMDAVMQKITDKQCDALLIKYAR
jgi:hypothetical protein